MCIVMCYLYVYVIVYEFIYICSNIKFKFLVLEFIVLIVYNLLKKYI